MAHFEVGKKVIAIKSHSQGRYKRGQVFALNGIRKAHCNCKPLLLDIGITAFATLSCCTTCGSSFPIRDGINWYNSNHFAPYDDSLSELTAEDILNEQTVTI